MSRRIGIIRTYRRQKMLHRIRMNIFANFQETIAILQANFRKALLPNRRAKSEFPSRSKRKATLDQLNRLFYRHIRSDRDQHMKVVRHDHKFVKEVFSLLPVVIKNVDQESGGAGRLQEAHFGSGGGGD